MRPFFIGHAFSIPGMAMHDSLTASNDARLVQLANDLQDPAKHQRAAADLWSLLNDFLMSRISARLDSDLQGKISVESAGQEMWATFFRRRAEGEYTFEDSDDVRGLLFTIGYNKLIDRIRRLAAKKRNPHVAGGHRAGNKNQLATGGSEFFDVQPAERNNVEGGEFAGGQQVVGPEKLMRRYGKKPKKKPQTAGSCSAPVEEIMHLAVDPGVGWLDELLASADPIAAELINERVNPLDDDLKTVLRLQFSGYSLEEIAAETNRTEKEVRRKQKALREAFHDLHDDSRFGIHAPRHRPKASP